MIPLDLHKALYQGKRGTGYRSQVSDSLGQNAREHHNQQ